MEAALAANPRCILCRDAAFWTKHKSSLPFCKLMREKIAIAFIAVNVKKDNRNSLFGFLFFLTKRRKFVK
jgi:hypothetical protein